MFIEFQRRFKWAPRFTSKLQILLLYGTVPRTPSPCFKADLLRILSEIMIIFGS